MRHRGSPPRVVLLGTLGVAGLAILPGVVPDSALLARALQPPAQATPSAPTVQSAIDGTLPVVAEYRYRMLGKLRILLFWVSRDGVGGARIRVRRGDGNAAGYDMLIGSDPRRAPRGINRWGYILEETRGDQTTVVGLMKKSDEDTLDQAASNVAKESQGGVVFKMIQATVTAAESVANVTTAAVARDYSYRELISLAGALSAGASEPKVRRIPVPDGGRHGLMTSIVELIREATDAVQMTGQAPGRRSLSYVYYSKQYEVTRVSASVQKGQAYGGVTYPKLLRASFEVRAKGESWTEKFTIVSGIGGATDGIPVFVRYQPRWWLAVEMVLDDKEKF
jgi:hypothetical protein